jgi:hypothetical protein
VQLAVLDKSLRGPGAVPPPEEFGHGDPLEHDQLRAFWLGGYDGAGGNVVDIPAGGPQRAVGLHAPCGDDPTRCFSGT